MKAILIVVLGFFAYKWYESRVSANPRSTQPAGANPDTLTPTCAVFPEIGMKICVSGTYNNKPVSPAPQPANGQVLPNFDDGTSYAPNYSVETVPAPAVLSPRWSYQL